MDSLARAAAIAVSIVLSLWAAFAPSGKVKSRALSVSLVVFALIPTYGPSRIVAALPLILSLLLTALALLRDQSAAGRVSGVLLITVFAVYYAITEIANSSLLSLGLIAVQALAFILIAATLRRSAITDETPLLSALIALTPFEALLAVLEQIRVVPYVWARDTQDDSYDIALRNNELAPMFIGRSEGTFAHPILLGMFCATTLTLCIVAAFRTRKWSYLIPALIAGGTLALSGTRSAAAAAAVGIALWLVLRPGRWLVLRLGFATVVGLIIGSGSDLRAYFTDSSLTGSVSYVHRTDVLSSLPRLLSRSGFDVTFGSGAGSIDSLFDSGLVSGFGDYHFFDNQYVRLLALSGVVGLLLFVIAAIVVFVRGTRSSRLLLVVVMVMMASFDTLTWSFSYFITIVALTGTALIPGENIEQPLDKISPREGTSADGSDPYVRDSKSGELKIMAPTRVRDE